MLWSRTVAWLRHSLNKWASSMQEWVGECQQELQTKSPAIPVLSMFYINIFLFLLVRSWEVKQKKNHTIKYTKGSLNRQKKGNFLLFGNNSGFYKPNVTEVAVRPVWPESEGRTYAARNHSYVRPSVRVGIYGKAWRETQTKKMSKNLLHYQWKPGFFYCWIASVTWGRRLLRMRTVK